MRCFTGFRPSPPEDYTNKGISNGGWMPDYQGVVFDDGTVVVRWLTAYRSHSIWSDFETFYKVHGHPEYGTRIEWYDLVIPATEAIQIVGQVNDETDD